MFHWIRQIVHSLLLPVSSKQHKSVDEEQNPIQHWLELTSGVTNWQRFNSRVEDTFSDGSSEGSLSAPAHLNSQPRGSIDDQVSNHEAIEHWREMVTAATDQNRFNAEHPLIPDHAVAPGVVASHDANQYLTELSNGARTTCQSDTHHSEVHDRQLMEALTCDEPLASHTSSMDRSGHQLVAELPTVARTQNVQASHPQTSERFIQSADRPVFAQAQTEPFVSQTVVQDPEWTPLPSFRSVRSTHTCSTLKGLPSRQVRCHAGSLSDSLWSD